MVGQHGHVQPEVALAHQLAGVEQRVTQRGIEIAGCQHGAAVHPAVHLNSEVLPLRGSRGIQHFTAES